MTPKRVKAALFLLGAGLVGAAALLPNWAPVFTGLAVFLRSPLTEQAIEDLGG